LDTIISYAKISSVISVVLNSSYGGRIELHGEIDKAMTLRPFKFPCGFFMKLRLDCYLIDTSLSISVLFFWKIMLVPCFTDLFKNLVLTFYNSCSFNTLHNIW